MDGHECLKISVKRKETAQPDEEIYLYAAKDLKNLIIMAQISNARANLVQRLENISLAVDPLLVEIPADYRPIEKDLWKKVPMAKVKYNGVYSKDFGVFRSPTGELFVWIKDAKYDWQYLLRPNRATVETAFQGMLVTHGGEYIWRTQESEAWSATFYRQPTKEAMGGTKPLQVRPRSLKFESNDSKDIWIEIIFE